MLEIFTLTYNKLIHNKINILIKIQYNKVGLNTACYVLTQKKSPMRDRIHWQPGRRWLFWLPADYKQKPQTDCPQGALPAGSISYFNEKGAISRGFKSALIPVSSQTIKREIRD